MALTVHHKTLGYTVHPTHYPGNDRTFFAIEYLGCIECGDKKPPFFPFLDILQPPAVNKRPTTRDGCRFRNNYLTNHDVLTKNLVVGNGDESSSDGSSSSRDMDGGSRKMEVLSTAVLAPPRTFELLMRCGRAPPLPKAQVRTAVAAASAVQSPSSPKTPPSSLPPKSVATAAASEAMTMTARTSKEPPTSPVTLLPHRHDQRESRLSRSRRWATLKNVPVAVAVKPGVG